MHLLQCKDRQHGVMEELLLILVQWAWLLVMQQHLWLQQLDGGEDGLLDGAP